MPSTDESRFRRSAEWASRTLHWLHAGTKHCGLLQAQRAPSHEDRGGQYVGSSIRCRLGDSVGDAASMPRSTHTTCHPHGSTCRLVSFVPLVAAARLMWRSATFRCRLLTLRLGLRWGSVCRPSVCMSSWQSSTISIVEHPLAQASRRRRPLCFVRMPVMFDPSESVHAQPHRRADRESNCHLTKLVLPRRPRRRQNAVPRCGVRCALADRSSHGMGLVFRALASSMASGARRIVRRLHASVAFSTLGAQQRHESSRLREQYWRDHSNHVSPPVLLLAVTETEYG